MYYKLFTISVAMIMFGVMPLLLSLDKSSMPSICVRMVAKQIVKAGDIVSYGDKDSEVYAANGWPSSYGPDEFLIELETTSIKAENDAAKNFLTENLLDLPCYIPHSVIYSRDKCGYDMHAFETLEFVTQGCKIKANFNLDASKVSDWNSGKNSYDLFFLIRNHGLSWKELCMLGVSAAAFCLLIATFFAGAKA